MSQPVASGQYTVISGTVAGTTVIADRSVNMVRVVSPANNTGTVLFFDCATAAGTASTNAITNFACTTGSIPVSVEFGISTHKGLTAVSGGTVNLVVVTD